MATSKSISRFRSCFHTLSALLISSAHSGKLVRSLELLLKPLPVNNDNTYKLAKEYPSLLVQFYSKNLLNKFHWVPSYASTHTLSKPSATYLSGLAAFPLPSWPFLLPGDDLQIFEHLQAYLSAYHPSIRCLITANHKVEMSVNSESIILELDSVNSTTIIRADYTNTLDDYSETVYFNGSSSTVVLKSSCNSLSKPKAIFDQQEVPKSVYKGPLIPLNFQFSTSTHYCTLEFYSQLNLDSVSPILQASFESSETECVQKSRTLINNLFNSFNIPSIL